MSKTQTFAYIEEVLILDVAAIVEGYLKPITEYDWIRTGESGYWELCLKIADPTHGLVGACMGGHLELANLFIGRGADLEEGLYAATMRNQIHMIQPLIDRGAKNVNDSMHCACEFGNYTIAQLMIAHGANNWNKCLNIACEYGHVAMIRLMIAHGATACGCIDDIQEHLRKCDAISSER